MLSNLVLENRMNRILKRKFLSLSQKVKQTWTVINGMKSCTFAGEAEIKTPLLKKNFPYWKSREMHRAHQEWEKLCSQPAFISDMFFLMGETNYKLVQLLCFCFSTPYNLMKILCYQKAQIEKSIFLSGDMYVTDVIN